MPPVPELAVPLVPVLLPLAALVLAFSQQKAPAPVDVAVEPGTPQAWMLLSSSVLFERNQDRHDLLAGEPAGPGATEKAKKLLEEWWSVETRADLLDKLVWLEKEGHRKSFDELAKKFGKSSGPDLEKKLSKLFEDDRKQAEFAAKNASRLGSKSILAWDLGRYVALCRWGYGAGYLTEAEAWERMLPVARKLQKTFSSWEELGGNFCDGREFWSPGENEETKQAFERLRTSETSPWKSTRWDVKLDLKPAKAAKTAPAK